MSSSLEINSETMETKEPIIRNLNDDTKKNKSKNQKKNQKKKNQKKKFLNKEKHGEDKTSSVTSRDEKENEIEEKKIKQEQEIKNVDISQRYEVEETRDLLQKHNPTHLNKKQQQQQQQQQLLGKEHITSLVPTTTTQKITTTTITVAPTTTPKPVMTPVDISRHTKTMRLDKFSRDTCYTKENSAKMRDIIRTSIKAYEHSKMTRPHDRATRDYLLTLSDIAFKLVIWDHRHKLH